MPARKRITSKQRAARRKNIAVARAAKSKGKGRQKISSAHGDFQYSTKKMAKNYINRTKKPGKWSLMKKSGKKYLVTTNRRSGAFAKQGYKRVSQWG